VFNLETNIVVESCDMMFNETAPYSRDAFECAGDKEMEKSIFVDEEIQSFDRDKDGPLLSSISSLELVPASTLEVEATLATTSFIATVVALRVEGKIISDQVAPSHI
jgi:hypothetical protein